MNILDVARELRAVEREMDVDHLKKRMLGTPKDIVLFEFQERAGAPWKTYAIREMVAGE